MKLTMFAALLGTTALIPLGAMAQSSNPASQPNANQQAGQAQQNLSLVVSQMRNQTLFSQSGQEIGRITRVVQGRDNQTYAVVAAGNGEVLIPSSRLAHQNNRLMMTGANDLPRLQTYNQQSASQYRDVDPNVRVAIVAFAVDPSGAARPAGDGARIVLQQAAPTIRVDPADPQVTVRQAQPQVTVNQAQPEIIVRQPQPTVRVDIPQPEIIVRMPQPDVNVALAQPQVRVNSAPPQVQVVQPPQQPQVEVERSQPQVLLQRSADMEPNVQVQQAEGQPTVRYERSEPRVIVNQAQGQPNVRIERMDQNQQANAQATPNVGSGQRTTSAMTFAAFDRDQNRSLTQNEFNPFATRVYSGWDGNRNQRLERNEFYSGMYGVWDTNRDNRLTEDEYNQAWGTWGEGLGEAEFGRFDRNRDGFLDQQEFAGGWGDQGLYERWDADGGGWLAENEFGNGLFGMWGNNGQVAENDFSPWMGRNWGSGRMASADVNTTEAQREPASTGAVSATRSFRITDLENRDVYSVRGQKIGEVKRLVRRIGDNQGYIVLEHGGFLGLGEKEVPLPLNRMFMMGDRLVAAGMTEPEIRAAADWDFNDREYREFGNNEAVEIGQRG